MGEVQFNCPSCGQSVAAAAEIAGEFRPCPCCSRQIQVPGSAPVSADPDPPLSALSDVLDLSAALDSANRELAQTKSVLVETLQQFRKVRDELETVRSEAEAGEKNLATIHAQLLGSQAEVEKLQIQLKNAQIQEQTIRTELEAVKTERNAYLWESKRLEDLLARSNQQLNQFQKQAELHEEIQNRGMRGMEKLSRECVKLKGEVRAKTEAMAQLRDALKLTQKTELQLVQERDDLVRQLQASKDAGLLQLTQTRLHTLERDLEQVGAENHRLRQRAETGEDQIQQFKAENLQLRLQLAATREQLSESVIEQENQLLRGILERTNQQIRVQQHHALSSMEGIIRLNEPVAAHEPLGAHDSSMGWGDVNRFSAGLRWLQGLLTKWGHPT